MSLSLKQQLNNANTDLNAIEGEVNTLKTQTAEAIAFHHNFVTSDENIVQLVNRTCVRGCSVYKLHNILITCNKIMVKGNCLCCLCFKCIHFTFNCG